jgi:ATP phosphoribosyltransferase
VPPPLVLAVSKGRTAKALVSLLSRAGIDPSALAHDDRTLIRDAGALRFLLLKADDVPTYVEHGAADLGVCGRDVLRERESDLLVPLDLQIGRCTMVVAARTQSGGGAQRQGTDMPRVATKYPVTTAAHFAARGVQVEIIALAGSVELAPPAGLADLVVDLVETGETLRMNGLEIIERVATVSTVLAVNRAAYKLRRLEIVALIDRLRAVVAHGAPASGVG